MHNYTQAKFVLAFLSHLRFPIALAGGVNHPGWGPLLQEGPGPPSGSGEAGDTLTIRRKGRPDSCPSLTPDSGDGRGPAADHRGGARARPAGREPPAETPVQDRQRGAAPRGRGPAPRPRRTVPGRPRRQGLARYPQAEARSRTPCPLPAPRSRDASGRGSEGFSELSGPEFSSFAFQAVSAIPTRPGPGPCPAAGTSFRKGGENPAGLPKRGFSNEVPVLWQARQ
jgi:hypothetical protein